MKGKVDSHKVYLPHYARDSRFEVEQSVMARARQEGYRGSLVRRLKQLRWEIVEVGIVPIAH